MRIPLAAALLATACSQAQPKPVPEATREAAGQRVDAGPQAANEPGGTALGTEDAGAKLIHKQENSSLITVLGSRGASQKVPINSPADAPTLLQISMRNWIGVRRQRMKIMADVMPSACIAKPKLRPRFGD